jgi:hypothetical protein
MDKLTAEETKNKSDQRLDVRCRSGRVCVAADFGTDLVVPTTGGRSGLVMIPRPLSVVASKSSNKGRSPQFLSAAHGHR